VADVATTKESSNKTTVLELKKRRRELNSSAQFGNWMVVSLDVDSTSSTPGLLSVVSELGSWLRSRSFS